MNKAYLAREWRNAHDEVLTPDCRFGECSGCGVCDFKKVLPRVHEAFEGASGCTYPTNPAGDSLFKKMRVSFEKRNQARFFGHLELVNLFMRAFRRARIRVKFSEGFHPKPRISFDDPLPIGLESQHETLQVIVGDEVKPADLVRDLNRFLPAGLSVTGCELAPGKAAAGAVPTPVTYQITLGTGEFATEPLERFLNGSEFLLTRRNKKGNIRTINLKSVVDRLARTQPGCLLMTLKIEPGTTVRPHEVLATVFELPDEQIRRATIVKLKMN